MITTGRTTRQAVGVLGRGLCRLVNRRLQLTEHGAKGTLSAKKLDEDEVVRARRSRHERVSEQFLNGTSAC